MIRVLLRIQWVVIPLCFALIVESAVRKRIDSHWGWYESTTADSVDSFGAIFIGTSRVGASIDVTSFAAASGIDSPLRVLNMGRGYSTLIQHWLGLRNMVDANPNCLRGTTVFLEAPTGVPDHSTSSARWAFDQAPQQLIMQMKVSDISGLMHSQGAKGWRLTYDFFASSSRAVAYCDWIRRLVRRRATERLQRFIDTRPTAASESVDLAEAAGVRTDKAGVDLVRQQIMAKATATDIVPCAPFAETVLAKLNRLVSQAGGELVLYDIPLSTPARIQFKRSISAFDRSRFLSEVRDAGIRTLRPDFTHDDSDFPDLSHLRKSRQAEFSRNLAEVWLESRKP